MALDPLQAAGVKAGIKVVDTVTTVIDNAAVSAEQAAAVSRMKVENNATRDENMTTGLVSAERVNKAFVENKGYSGPFTEGTFVNVGVSKANTVSNMVVEPGQANAIAEGRPAIGQFSTPDSVTNATSARESLAITTDMKKSETLMVQPVVTTGKSMVILEGKVAPQDPANTYPGGGNQIYFDFPKDAVRTDYVKPVGSATELPLK